MALLSYHFQDMYKTVQRASILLSDASPKAMEYSLEVYNAALNGKIDLDKVEDAARRGDMDSEFNLSAYVNEVRRNTILAEATRSKKFLYMSDADYDDEEGSDPYGVSESVVAKYAEQVDEYERLDNEDEFNYAVEALSRMEQDILIKYHVDFWHCMRQALRGLPDAIDLLKELAEKAPNIRELMWIVLSSGNSLSDLHQMAAA